MRTVYASRTVAIPEISTIRESLIKEIEDYYTYYYLGKFFFDQAVCHDN